MAAFRAIAHQVRLMVPIYIAAIATLMLANAVWRCRQRDMAGMADTS
jgi:hypothetical protein